MTTSSIKISLFSLLFFPFLYCFAQEDAIVFWQPQVAINYNVYKDYSHNFTLANRNFLVQNEDLDLSIQQIDLVHFSNLKITDNKSISLGLMWRNSNLFDNGQVDEFRITEQFNIRNSPHSVRYGHRFRAEQRISSVLTIYRFRYRFAIDFPLEGKTLDIGESYMLWSVENLASFSNSIKPFYDLRLRGGIGWRLSQRSNLQISLEYRMVDYTRVVLDVFLLETTLNLGL
ncbi:MAG: DUF2490 domain-containing protein [Flavobacteriaceae bacterium]